MRFSNILEAALGTKPKIKILRALLKVKAPLTGRKIALLSNLNHRTCLLALKEFVKEGFISARAAGKSNIYTLNTENIFLKESLSRLFTEETNLLPALLKRVSARLKGIAQAMILFGSVAIKSEQPDSDIDICLVVETLSDKKKVENIIDRERDWVSHNYGNELAFYIITKNDFLRKFRAKNKLVREIADKGIFFAGKRFF